MIGKIQDAKLRNDIVNTLAAVLTKRSTRYTKDGKPQQRAAMYLEQAENLVHTAEAITPQLMKHDGKAYSTLSWLCVMVGPAFEKDILKLKGRTPPGCDL